MVDPRLFTPTGRAADLLSGKEWVRGRGDLMGALSVVALSVIRGGEDYWFFVDLVTDRERCAFSEELPEKPEEATLSAWAWSEENFQPATVTADDIRGRAADLMVRVLLFDGYEPMAHTVRALGLALLSVAVERGAYSFDCSARFLAGRAGISDQSKASKALKFFAGVGLIEVSGKGRQTRKVSIDLDWQGPGNPTTNKSIGGIVICSRGYDYRAEATGAESGIFPHDVWTATGLGPVAGWVWWLSRRGLNLAEVSSALGLDETEVSRAADALAGAGLGVVDSGSFVAIDEPELDDVAVELGCSGRISAIQAGFEQQTKARNTDVEHWKIEQEVAREEDQKRLAEFRQALLGMPPDPFEQAVPTVGVASEVPDQTDDDRRRWELEGM